MIQIKKFSYEPGEHEAETASSSYLMSLIAIIVGLPLPIVNLIATLIFYLGNRKSTYFVRWHCTQALLSQLSMLFINSYGFWWTVSIIFTEESITSNYIAKQNLLLKGSILTANGIKYGFVDRQGNWVIQPTFDDVQDFDEKGYAFAKINEKWGCINRQGNWVIQPRFDDVEWAFDEMGFSKVMINEKYGVINRHGNWVIQPTFDDVLVFDEKGYAFAKINEKWGCINRQGNWVIQPMFDSVKPFDTSGNAMKLSSNRIALTWKCASSKAVNTELVR